MGACKSLWCLFSFKCFSLYDKTGKNSVIHRIHLSIMLCISKATSDSALVWMQKLNSSFCCYMHGFTSTNQLLFPVRKALGPWWQHISIVTMGTKSVLTLTKMPHFNPWCSVASWRKKEGTYFWQSLFLWANFAGGFFCKWPHCLVHVILSSLIPLYKCRHLLRTVQVIESRYF
jgi:hypothetical protein